MDDQEWQEANRKKSNSVFQGLKFPSNEDQTQKISKSVFVTNFPDHFTARDLWNVCVAYGKVVDVFIPFKRSKAGKKFTFVRFIRVDKLDRLIEDLSTIWIGRSRLHANVVRFQREPKTNNVLPNNNASQPKENPVGNVENMGAENRSFASVLHAGRGNTSKVIESTPAIVLDDNYLLERDYSCSLMGKIKDIDGLPNLYLILSKEGFENVKLTHLGGLSVLLDLDSIETKKKVFNHVGVGSWFNGLQPACGSFVCDERITWISIEGLPIKAMTHNTFVKIVSSWGELTEIEDPKTNSLSYKQLCELESWSPKFIDLNDEDLESGDETDGEEKDNNNGNFENDLQPDNEYDLDHVSESSCMHANDQEHNYASKCTELPNHSDDPFEIYKILDKNKDKVVSEKNKDKPKEDLLDKNKDIASVTSGIKGFTTLKSGGSLLDVIEELIKGLGHKAKKGWIQELNTKHRVSFVALQETKMEKIDLFSIKELWGNFSFDYVFSPSVGFSGGILCVWDPSLFLKDNSTISDSFVAIRGTWIPSSTKILIISVYAPQELTEKRILWDYLRHMINDWDGECVILGDFNEVRSIHERFGTVFNPFGANSFNNFINMAGLINLPLEGYSFTWPHKSASKMSKLDRFLISEGLLTLYPSLSALCLDRHLSDHRPILLRELKVDYGSTLFRFFHS
ncbi:RNA-directed DNA polymerase, eukaryota [Tanacetum coccineum]